MYNPSPYSPRQEVTTPDAVSIPRCLRAHESETPALSDTRNPARGKTLKQYEVVARHRRMPRRKVRAGCVAPRAEREFHTLTDTRKTAALPLSS